MPWDRIGQTVSVDGQSAISKLSFTDRNFSDDAWLFECIITDISPVTSSKLMGTAKVQCGVSNSTTSRVKQKKWTEEETERTEKLLQKRFQIWEIAHHLGRPVGSVRWRLKYDEQLRSLLMPMKTGRWSEKEIEYLAKLRIQGLHNSMIAKRLRRSQASVDNKNSQHINHIRRMAKPSIVQGPQAISPAHVDLIFQARLRSSWDCLIRSEMTETWREVLSQKDIEFWLSSGSESRSNNS